MGKRNEEIKENKKKLNNIARSSFEPVTLNNNNNNLCEKYNQRKRQRQQQQYDTTQITSISLFGRVTNDSVDRNEYAQLSH